MNFLQILLISIKILQIDSISNEKIFYDNYELISLTLSEDDHFRWIRHFENEFGVDRWTETVRLNQPIKMTLPKSQIESIRRICHQQQIQMKIIENGLNSLIEQSKSISEQHKRRNQRSIFDRRRNHLNEYLNYHEIVRFLHDQNIRSPKLSNFTSLFSIGQTHENRSIWAIRIGKTTAKRQILIDCGIHAREFISPSTCLYMIEKFIDEINRPVPSILSIYNIFIIPLLNPDGYQFAHDFGRMWRKNRSPNGYRFHFNSQCIGVDLNRNFGYHWMENGASINPCSETYAGPYQDSELETKSLQRFIKSSVRRWDSYLTFHSYGQYWIYPWGFALRVPDDHLELKNKATIGSEALKRVNGTRYKIGSSANLLYESAGGSDDWAKGVAQIKYVYTVELRPSDDINDAHAHFAFMLPSTFIQPVGQETFVGVKEFLRSIIFSRKTKKHV